MLQPAVGGGAGEGAGEGVDEVVLSKTSMVEFALLLEPTIREASASESTQFTGAITETMRTITNRISPWCQGREQAMLVDDTQDEHMSMVRPRYTHTDSYR